MKLSVAYSPCPNDTFAFHAMVHGLIDCEGLEFEPHLMDVEELNKGSKKGLFDLCKMSYHSYFTVLKEYIMLRSGSALGYGNGPILVSPLKGYTPVREDIVLTPGSHTTAALLLKILFPHLIKTQPILFSSIESKLINGEGKVGLLIHEGRFTYQSKGLHLIADLGEEWNRVNRLPIPLGGIAIKRAFSHEVALKIERVLKRSIEFAIQNSDASKEYVKGYAQEMDREVLSKHISMFVNDFTVSIGEEGELAVKALYGDFLKLNNNFNEAEELFIRD